MLEEQVGTKKRKTGYNFRDFNSGRLSGNQEMQWVMKSNSCVQLEWNERSLYWPNLILSSGDLMADVMSEMTSVHKGMFKFNTVLVHRWCNADCKWSLYCLSWTSRESQAGTVDVIIGELQFRWLNAAGLFRPHLLPLVRSVPTFPPETLFPSFRQDPTDSEKPTQNTTGYFQFIRV